MFDYLFRLLTPVCQITLRRAAMFSHDTAGGAMFTRLRYARCCARCELARRVRYDGATRVYFIR